MYRALAGVAASEPGPRARRRPRALALRPLGLGFGLDRLVLVVGDEDLGLGLAVEQGDELVGVDRLALEQDVGDPVELLAAFGQEVFGGLVGGLDDAADLVVDLARDLIRVVGLGGELAAEEGLAAIVAEDTRAEPL